MALVARLIRCTGSNTRLDGSMRLSARLFRAGCSEAGKCRARQFQAGCHVIVARSCRHNPIRRAVRHQLHGSMINFDNCANDPAEVCTTCAAADPRRHDSAVDFARQTPPPAGMECVHQALPTSMSCRTADGQQLSAELRTTYRWRATRSTLRPKAARPGSASKQTSGQCCSLLVDGADDDEG